MKLGGYLDLCCNEIVSPPESIGTMKIGGDLDFYCNQIVSLPESTCIGTMKIDVLER